MTNRASFTQAQIRRALKAARDAGYAVAGFKITPEGFEVTFGEPGLMKGKNPWDKVLDETTPLA